MSIRKYIPNCVTSMNLVCGIIGVMFAFKARFDMAFWCMLAAGVFDFLDGFAARALNAYSDMGKELDSLCDIVSFGVLPAIMLSSLMRTAMFGENWLCWIPLVLVLGSALRLAKFNVDPRQTSGFLGLPTPACAILCGALCVYVCHDPSCFLATWAASPFFIPVMSVCLTALLVSEVPMFSFKMHKDDPSILKNKRLAFVLLAVACVVACVVLKLHWSLAVLLSMLCYVLKNIVYRVVGI